MGSVFEYISIEKAEEALGVSRRQVYYYIKRGRLRTAKDGKKQLVLREDVMAAIEERQNTGSLVPLSKETVRRHESRIHMLEKRVSLLMRIHDLHQEPLNMSPVELKRLHDEAEYCLQESWAPQQEGMWKDFFLRLQLEDLEKLNTVVPNADPWLVFHTLCKTLLEAPHNKDLKLQFQAGKVHLEKIAYVWVTTNRKNSRELDQVIKGEQKQVNKTVRRVKARRVKK